MKQVTQVAVNTTSRTARTTRGMRSSASQLAKSLAPALGLTLALAAVAPLAQATTFGVRVLDGAGAPVAGVAVCIGLEGNYKQFGALFTDASGTASVDVPNVPLVVTVSKNRFTGMRMPEPARGFNLIKEVRLVEGLPGPRCRAGSSLAGPGIPGIKVNDVDVMGNARSMVLNADVSGDPTHYRVAGDPDFAGSNWQRYRETIPVPGSLADSSELFLQLRRYSGSTNAWLEARSEVTTIRLPHN